MDYWRVTSSEKDDSSCHINEYTQLDDIRGMLKQKKIIRLIQIFLQGQITINPFII